MNQEDTANQVGTIGECLYSIGNRVAIAKILSTSEYTRLLETELEDIFYFCQVMLDEHCVLRNE